MSLSFDMKPTACMQAAAADKTAKQRLGQLDAQLEDLKKEQAELTKQWEREKEEMRRLQSIKNEIDRVNLEIQSAERDYDLNRAAELKYGTVLQLQKQLKEAEEALEKEAVSSYALMMTASLSSGLHSVVIESSVCQILRLMHCTAHSPS